jgi:O-methyltransferase
MASQLKQYVKSILPTRLVNLVRTLRRLRHYTLVLGPLTYNQDGLATRHNCDFLTDQRFREAYQMGKELGGWGRAEIQWRAFVTCWAANRAVSLGGDFVECGVNRGGLAMTVMHYIDFKSLDRKFYLLDTFCGLVEKYINEEEKQQGIVSGGYEECYEFVKETFRDFPNVEIIRGTVPDTLPLVKAEKVAYLEIDMNCAEPEIAAAQYFWDKLVSGAVVILDDYGWKGHIVQKRAFDQFAQHRGVHVLPLPTGQGLIFKP